LDHATSALPSEIIHHPQAASQKRETTVAQSEKNGEKRTGQLPSD
jgi:hypothetical protein